MHPNAKNELCFRDIVPSIKCFIYLFNFYLGALKGRETLTKFCLAST